MQRKIILASKSERRKSLLEQIGLDFDVRESEYEEDMNALDDPYELVKFLALGKAQDVAKHYNNEIVIGSDTFVFFNGKFIGKPKNVEDAKKILSDFSGKTHNIVTGFAIIDTKTGTIINDYGEARVTFRDLTEEEIDDYVATGEPTDKAGAYGLMHRAAVLIEKVEGDFYSVIGLPLNKIFVELKKLGVNALKP
ncbi:MAG: Maf family protein [Candidatus Pacebacteria bacterium]|nr:Maf family protein [Candidatus Paceibacterota bacterium]